jgi:predicted dehydrogenase
MKPLPMPRAPFPIVVLGAGGIVRDAHLPAYRLAGFPVWGICDQAVERARALAGEHGIPHVFGDLGQAIAQAPADAVFDLALPASRFLDVLRRLPPGASVLMQKPMGETLAQAREIVALCRERSLKASVNSQLRYAPFVRQARELIDLGGIGELLDLEVRLDVDIPWEIFPSLAGRPRMEIVHHSIHYIDLARSFLGEPRSLLARTYSHPAYPALASVRSTLLLDYPDPLRVTITANHTHRFGPAHQESYVKWEGTRGAIRARIGLLLNYPHGAEDRFEYCTRRDGEVPVWQTIEVAGSWFPHAFIGPMADAMRWKEGAIPRAPTHVEDALKTMACVEAAYASNAQGGFRPETLS